MSSTRKKNGSGVRIATAKPRKSRDKDSHEEAGDDNQDAEENQAEDDDVFEDQEPPIDGMASLQKQFAQLQKQFARVQQERLSTKPSASNDRAAAGPASTTSSSTEETQFYHDDHLNRLAAVVGNASVDAQHDPQSRHTSSAWRASIGKYDKILPERDRIHINTHSCIARLLLHFYERVQDAHERDCLDEAIQLVLDFFADIQTRLQYPSSPEIASKISQCVRATRHLQNAGLGSIQGIPSASPELTGFITRLHEKVAEESFRSIFKDGAKTAKASETDDYDVERKAFKVEIQALKDERNRLEKFCLDRNLDPRSRKQKASDKGREQATDDPSRNSSRQRDTTRSNRQGAATRNDRGRQHVDGNDNAADAAELATSPGDE
jgi:hypothetical protein